MGRGTWWAAIASLALAGATLYFGSKNSGFYQDILISLFGTFFGAFIAIVAVNIFLAGREKKYAAGPLVDLIATPTQRYHNDLFVQLGRDTFGIAKWNSLLDSYVGHKGNPDCFSPEDRKAVFDMVKSRQDDLIECIREIETTMSDVISVLNWSFDAKIVGAAISCKKAISDFRLNLTKSDAPDEKRVVELFIDIDAAANMVILSLGALSGNIETSDINPSLAKK